MTSQELGFYFLVTVALGGAVFAVAVGLSQIVFYRRLRELEVAMVRYPSYADVRAQLASLHYKYGHVIQAKKYYYEALKIYQYYNYARLKLGLLCLEQHEADEAMHHFRRIRNDAAADEAMQGLLEGLLREKGLMEAYLREPERPTTDEEFAHRLL